MYVCGGGGLKCITQKLDSVGNFRVVVRQCSINGLMPLRTEPKLQRIQKPLRRPRSIGLRKEYSAIEYLN